MRKSSFFAMSVVACAFAFLGNNVSIKSVEAEESVVYIGGMPAGFTLRAGSVHVVGLCEVATEDGIVSPATRAGLRAGDRIVKVNGIAVESIVQLNEIMDKCKDKEAIIEVERGGERKTFSIHGAKDKETNHYKIGILAKDSVSGIGTVTYIDKTNNRFGALGHSVEIENKKETTISNGFVYECSIVGVSKGVRGRAGELRGMFLSDKKLGNAEKLCHCGIFGELSSAIDFSDLQRTVVDSESVAPGKAFIYSTVNGISPQKYEIEIVKVDKRNKENKNYVIKVLDEELIEQTGGIVQGMSGSPIIQNNKLVGAITHVFLNDPTRGYGIDIQTMMKE